MAIQQNGYVCFAFTCDHNSECSANTLMSSVDQLSAALRLTEKGWSFELDPQSGDVVVLCPVHSQAPSVATMPRKPA